MNRKLFAPLALGFALSVAGGAAAGAANYMQADFSGQLGSSPNVKTPFSGNGYSGGQSVGGHFVFDTDLIPGAGLANVTFDSLADIADIPPAEAFQFDFGPLTFDLSDLAPGGIAAIQYNNGQFAGFVFQTQFGFQGDDWQLDIQGGVFTVQKVVGGFPQCCTNYVSGTLNIGNVNLANVEPYELPGAPVPEPSTWAMLVLGFGAVGGLLRRRAFATAG
jgi:PEP-CTERM motif-containing protein